ncbi:hypothetical protein GCM10027321_12100 [Massilia terrae]
MKNKKEDAMNMLSRLASDARAGMLSCCAMFALLAACGGSPPPASPSATQLAASETTQAPVVAPAALSDQITGLYWWLLGRQPDQVGLQFWQQSGLSADQIASAMKGSDELQRLHDWESIGSATLNKVWVDAAATGNREDGSTAYPYKTLAAAARAVKAASTTVYVKPGNYEGGFTTTANGNATAAGGADGNIYWISTVRWGARIVPPSSASRQFDDTTAWTNSGDFVQIVGFEVDGTKSADKAYDTWRQGIYTSGGHSVVRDNYVHDIARWSSCSSGAGGAAINIDASPSGGLSDAIGNWVRDIGQSGSNCNRFQGIYVSSSGSVINNVVYRANMGAAIHLYHEATAVKVINNTVASSNVGIVVGTGEYRGKPVEHKDSLIYNNIAYDNYIGIEEYVGRGGIMGVNSYKNNLVTANTRDWDKMRNTATGTRSGDPGFVQYKKDLLLPNFHLSVNSAADAAGTASSAQATDFDGRARAANANSIGAYEYVR